MGVATVLHGTLEISTLRAHTGNEQRKVRRKQTDTLQLGRAGCSCDKADVPVCIPPFDAQNDLLIQRFSSGFQILKVSRSGI